MKLGVKEVIGIVELILSSCNPQKAPDPELANGIETRRAIMATLDPPIPTEADLMRGQLTGKCTPAGQPLMGEQFPMRRGTELIKILGDGTCLERFREGKNDIIYAISGNRKIKFTNPNPREEERIFGQNDFGALQKLGIALISEIQAETVAGGSFMERAKSLMVLFEGPIDECPTYRYRRSMLADITNVFGGECIWDERGITCPRVTTATDSNYRDWQAFLENSQYVIPDTGTPLIPGNLGPGIAPKPEEWLGKQPRCPKPDSVVNIDF